MEARAGPCSSRPRPNSGQGARPLGESTGSGVRLLEPASACGEASLPAVARPPLPALGRLPVCRRSVCSALASPATAKPWPPPRPPHHSPEATLTVAWALSHSKTFRGSHSPGLSIPQAVLPALPPHRPETLGLRNPHLHLHQGLGRGRGEGGTPSLPAARPSSPLFPVTELCQLKAPLPPPPPPGKPGLSGWGREWVGLGGCRPYHLDSP